MAAVEQRAKIFISYSSKDKAFAQHVVQFLEQRGFEIWMDKNRILGGANYVQKIAEGIGRADIFLPLISKQSVGSKWVTRELSFATGKDKVIVPLLVDSTDLPDDFELLLSHIHRIDCAGSKLTQDSCWRELEDALSGLSSPDARADALTREKSSYQELTHYFKGQVSRPIPLWVVPLCVALALIAWYFWGPSGSKLPDQQKIQQAAAKVAPKIQNVLKVAYTAPLQNAPPKAASELLVKKANERYWRSLRQGEELSPHDRYYLVSLPHQQSHVYIFQVDSRGKLDWLFPKNLYRDYSSGQNPVPANQWVKIPAGKDQVLFLDKKQGVEQIFVVVSPRKWPVLERALAKASQDQTPPMQIAAAFDLPANGARGVAGTMKAETPPPLLTAAAFSSQAKLSPQIHEGLAGALTIRFWFKHGGWK